MNYRILNPWATARLDSCVVDSQRLLLADGSRPTAGEVLSAVQRGERVDFAAPGESGGWQLNPVVKARRTRGRGVRIRFADGRSVALTTGHVVPTGPARPSTGIDDSAAELPFTVLDEPCTMAGLVQAGDTLLDGTVVRVEQLGTVDAVRLWTAIPEWIHTCDLLTIGTRWHEIALGVAKCEEDKWGEEFPVSVTLWSGRPVISDAGDWRHLATAGWLEYRLRVNTAPFWEALANEIGFASWSRFSPIEMAESDFSVA